MRTVIDEFAYFEGEEELPPEVIERRHLDAILGADAVWLHAPNGYLGPSAAVELGWAAASGVPIFTAEHLGEPALRHLVHRVAGPEEAFEKAVERRDFRVPALAAMQTYYSRAASQRGYDAESVMAVVLLLTEELGELARAVRVREQIARHGGPPAGQVEAELSDILLYVLHLANTLGTDLRDAVAQKELRNHQRFTASRALK